MSENFGCNYNKSTCLEGKLGCEVGVVWRVVAPNVAYVANTLGMSKEEKRNLDVTK